MVPNLVRTAPAQTREIRLFKVRYADMRTGLLRSVPQRLKRAFDILFALALGLAALPVAAVIALAIVMDSPGPVFFRQTRVGKGNRKFRLWKFRSMVADADRMLAAYLDENPAGALEWKMTRKLKRDPRVTRVGRVLRKTSLDELPQLWNVLRGDMSMVGPRPIVREEMPRYGSAAFLYTQVSPGLTGLWQVSGRSDTSYRRRVELDSHYILHWTPWLDAKVLARTVRVVLGGRGAC